MDFGNKVTINDIAKAVGCSKATISRYLNGRTDLISQATSERIKAVIQMTNYQPNELARNLKKTVTNLVGIIIADIASPFSAPLIKGISEYLESIGYIPLFMDSHNNLEKEEQAVSSLIVRGVSGILVNTSSYENNFLVEKAAKGLPIVLCDRYIKDHNFDIVTNENDEIFSELLEHLKSNGYTRVAFFSEKILNSSSRIRRTDAFLKGMQKTYGYNAAADVYEIERDNDALTQSKLQKFFDSMGPDDVPAVIGVNAMITVILFKAIKKMHLSIPNDVGLCGSEDWDLTNVMNWPELLSPSITTIVIEPQLMGKKAAKLLVDRINNPAKPMEEVIIRNKLFLRESSQRN